MLRAADQVQPPFQPLSSRTKTKLAPPRHLIRAAFRPFQEDLVPPPACLTVAVEVEEQVTGCVDGAAKTHCGPQSQRRLFCNEDVRWSRPVTFVASGGSRWVPGDAPGACLPRSSSSRPSPFLPSSLPQLLFPCLFFSPPLAITSSIPISSNT